MAFIGHTLSVYWTHTICLLDTHYLFIGHTLSVSPVVTFMVI